MDLERARKSEEPRKDENDGVGGKSVREKETERKGERNPFQNLFVSG